MSTQRIINVQDMYDPGTGSAVGPIVTPQVVAFEINADGLSHNISAVMSGAHSATATPVAATAPSSCIPTEWLVIRVIWEEEQFSMIIMQTA